MNRKVLSPFPYYGGKARMSNTICQMLDYANTSIYIEPFGGGARVLLNKKRHQQELYNDFGMGLSTFFKVLTNKKMTEKLIELLLRRPPDEEEFYKLLSTRIKIEDCLSDSLKNQLLYYIRKLYRKYSINEFKRLRDAICNDNYRDIIYVFEQIFKNSKLLNIIDSSEELELLQYKELYENFWDIIRDNYISEMNAAECDFRCAWNQQLIFPDEGSELMDIYNIYKKSYIKDISDSFVHSYMQDTLNVNQYDSNISDLEIAYMIFKIYYSSRDGMGLAWSEDKNKNITSYNSSVRNLRRISERMENITVTQVDALDLIRIYRKNPEVMMYLDPSYLKPNENKNLGQVYKMSYNYCQHEALLKEITEPDTCAKIMISNYDVEIYNRYLYNWEKRYFKTYTGVGNKKQNRRTEVIWKNY